MDELHEEAFEVRMAIQTLRQKLLPRLAPTMDVILAWDRVVNTADAYANQLALGGRWWTSEEIMICPEGCGCEVGTDAEARDCGCDGACTGAVRALREDI